jgi:hypothetical protein
MNTQPPLFSWAVLKAGLIVGLLDATAASLHAYMMRGMSPEKVFQFVASGAFGQGALSGGRSMALIGLVFHFAIAMSWTFLFYAAFTKINILRYNMVLVGMAYGIFIWLIMNFIVIPLSFIGARPFNLAGASVQIMIHLFVIGLPISYLAYKYHHVR